MSSPSFRGTNAQQTAVVWNGININSQLTGQTDFNAITGQLYDEIAVRHGGASTTFGSGAVGGSVHLTTKIKYGKNKLQNFAQLGYGSYDTYHGLYKSTLSRKRFYIDIGLSYTTSDNDYDYLGTDLQNENGAFTYRNLHLNTGYTIDKASKIQLYHNYFIGDREFAGTLTAVSDDAYKDRTSRTMLEFTNRGIIQSAIRVAHLFEQFNYFPTANNLEINDQGRANTVIAQYEGSYTIDKKRKVQLLAAYNTTTATGTNIITDTRHSGTITGLYTEQLGKRFSYNAQLRREFTKDYPNATLYALGGAYDFIKARRFRPEALTYTTIFNASKNYRVPSFNDTSWQGAGAMGNPDIRPETSYQAELGHRLRWKGISLEATTFYINSSDLIVWRPDDSGVWSPININEARNYGAEVLMNVTRNFGRHIISAHATYAYTIAQDASTKNQLIYVPKHNFKTDVHWSYQKLSATAQFLGTSSVFYTSDNNNTVDGYGIANLGLHYTLLEKGASALTISLQAKNILNTEYQIINARPMPGRNFLIQTQYTF